MARILVVDEPLGCRELPSAVLREPDFGSHDVLTAPDGAVALGLLQANEIDLLLTNINMPGMDGIELARRARRNTRGSKCCSAPVAIGAISWTPQTASA